MLLAKSQGHWPSVPKRGVKGISLLQTKEGINFGLVRTYVTPYRISWIIFTYNLVIIYTDKVLVF